MKTLLFLSLLTVSMTNAFSQVVIHTDYPGEKPGKILCQLVAEYDQNKWENKFIYLDGSKPIQRQTVIESMGPFGYRIYVMGGGALILQVYRTGEKRHLSSATGLITDDIIGGSVLGNPAVRMENSGETASISCGDGAIYIDPNQN